MQADLQQNLRADSGKPLAFISSFRWQITAGTGISVITFAGRWLQFPGHYPPDRQYLLAWLRGEPTPASPFTPFADVGKSTSNTAKAKPGSVMRHSGGTASSTAAARVTFSGTFTGASVSADILRLKLEFTDGEFRRWLRNFQVCSVPI